MSIYYCPECGGIYEGKYFKENYDRMPCPDLNCGGECFEVDELMLEPIRILNEKGYYTRYCCSGHSYLSSCGGYILFADFIGDITRLVKEPPEGWRFDGRFSIRYSFDERKFGPERLLDILEYIKSLVNWAKELRYLNEEDYDWNESEY